ncbi:MAG: hypothetical protein ACLFWG_00085 [Longimicrobiales bacterium]
MTPVRLDEPEQDPPLTLTTIDRVEFRGLAERKGPTTASLDVLWGYEDDDGKPVWVRSRIVEIPAEDFWALVAEDPDLYSGVKKSLYGWLREQGIASGEIV